MHSKLGLRYDVLILPINIHTPPRDSQGSSVWLSWKSHAITWCIATSVSASASMPGAATNTAKPDHLHFSNLKCGWTKAKANVLCSFMWCCHFLLFLLILFFFFLSCIAANTGDQHKRSSVPMNHDFKAVIICYFCQHLLWRLKVTFPPRVNIIVLNICCLWAILELFKRRTATSGLSWIHS